MVKATQTTQAKASPTPKSPDELIKEHGGTKSAAIRALQAQGMKTGEIARALNIRYQHARNVLNRPLKTQSESAPAPQAPAAANKGKK